MAMVCLVVMPAYAQEDKKEAGLSARETKAQAEKNVQIANINALRNQELRVGVLQQVLNEEGAKLMQMQAVFCDQYKLDVDKFRAGKYQYDTKTGKFAEK